MMVPVRGRLPVLCMIMAIPMPCTIVAMLFRGELVAHQRAAIALAHDLLVAHAMARADRPL
jgi:hypothetical protein